MTTATATATACHGAPQLAPQRLTVDFETRSALKIKEVGGWAYSEHPSTEPVCLAFALGEGDEPKLWAPPWAFDLVAAWYLERHGVPLELDCPWVIRGPGMPPELAAAVAFGPRAEFEAHNAFFERAVWLNVMGPRYGWAQPHSDSWRCSAAKASSYALPRALEDAVAALGLPEQKDMAGNRVMQKVCRPRKARKAEKKELLAQGCEEAPDGGWVGPDGETFYLWSEDPADIFRTWEYCRQDVRAERCLSQSLADLDPGELAVWRMDQRVNMRGIAVDREMAVAALRIADDAVRRANDYAWIVTGGEIDRLSQRERLLDWINGRGVYMGNAQGATIDALLEDGDDDQDGAAADDAGLPDDVRILLRAKRTASRTSVKKYEAILRTLSRDGRLRDILMYHGAGTGRWTGKHVQPQNLVRGKMKDPDTMCSVIRVGKLDWLETCYSSDPMEVMSWAVRGAFVAPPGRDLVACDYSAVEARGTLWVAEDTPALEVFRRPKGEPGIYREMAAAIYNVPAASIDKDTPEGFLMRWVGKQAILGLGYGMGAKKFVDTCAKYGQTITLEFAKRVVEVYRKKFKSVVDFWERAEAAAIQAVRNPGQVYRVNSKVAFLMRGKFLYCRLPSGRRLAYCKPVVTDQPTPWGEPRPKLTYMTVDGKTHKWVRTDTWGGKLTENVVQALCRDLMAGAMLRLDDETTPYDVVLSVHDELVVEVDEGVGSVDEVIALMTALDDWAEGFPLAAEGWRGKRYRK